MSNPEAMAENHSVAEPAIASVFDMLMQRLSDLEQAADFVRRNEIYRQSGIRGRLFPELFEMKADRIVKHFEEDSVSGVFVRCSLEGASMTNHIFEGFMKRGEHQDVLQPDVLDKLRKKFGQDADCSKKQWADLGTTRPADFPTIGDEVTSRIVRKQFPQVQLYVADEASARFYLSFRGPQPILEACVVVESILQFMSRRYWEGVKDMIGRTFDPLSRLRMKDIMVDMLRNPDLRGGFSDYDDIRAEFAWEGVSDVLTQLEELNV